MSNDAHTPLYDEEKQKDYERVARLQYGPATVNESIRRWNGYGEARQAEILAEAGQIYADMAAALEAELPVHSPEVEAILDRWQANLRHFYEPTLDILRGLGEAYGTDPAFRGDVRQGPSPAAGLPLRGDRGLRGPPRNRRAGGHAGRGRGALRAGIKATHRRGRQGRRGKNIKRVFLSARCVLRGADCISCG